MPADEPGPLERAALHAIALFEAWDHAPTVASVWRALPGYQTSLANVRAALEPGAPLRRFVVEAHGRFALADRPDLLASQPGRQLRADACWRDLKNALRGGAKLPYVEAIAVTGGLARGGMADGELPAIVVIAEGGRTEPARACLRVFRKAAAPFGVRFQIAAVFPGDKLEYADVGWYAALSLLSVRPVWNEPAWLRVLDANPWAVGRFPSFHGRDSGGAPELLQGGRIDGKLAALRRRALGDDDGVIRTAGATPAWDSALAGLAGGRKLAHACEEWIADGVLVRTALAGTAPEDDEAFRARVDRLLASSPRAAPAPTPQEATEPPPSEPTGAPPNEPASGPARSPDGASSPPTRKRRGKESHPTRAPSPASPEAIRARRRSPLGRRSSG